jgi:uncharacterized protein YggL (DUF469 family)
LDPSSKVVLRKQVTRRRRRRRKLGLLFYLEFGLGFALPARQNTSKNKFGERTLPLIIIFSSSSSSTTYSVP